PPRARVIEGKVVICFQLSERFASIRPSNRLIRKRSQAEAKRPERKQSGCQRRPSEPSDRPDRPDTPCSVSGDDGTPRAYGALVRSYTIRIYKLDRVVNRAVREVG